jgi:tRNA G10  N-methylase Trm11
LTHLGTEHRVADVRHLSFPDEYFDAIATEPPYDQTAGNIPAQAVRELSRVLVSGGRMSMLPAEWQIEEVLRAAETAGLACLLTSPIDRKGLDCAVAVWEK